MVTTDGSVIGWPTDEAGGLGHSVPIGYIADFRANLRRLGMAADLDAGEWTAFAVLVLKRLDIVLGEQGEPDLPE